MKLLLDKNLIIISGKKFKDYKYIFEKDFFSN